MGRRYQHEHEHYHHHQDLRKKEIRLKFKKMKQNARGRKNMRKKRRKVRKNLIIVWRDLAEIMFTLIVKEWSLAWRQLLDVLRLRHHHHL